MKSEPESEAEHLDTSSIEYRLGEMGKGIEEIVMARVRARFEKSGLSLHDLGLRMGYPEESARKSAWQFISKTSDPRISMLNRFARALNVPVVELLAEKAVSKRDQPG